MTSVIDEVVMTRMVNCVVLKVEAEGLDAPPHPGSLGERIYENVSKEGWKQWLERLTTIINENGLNTADPKNIELIEKHIVPNIGDVPLQTPLNLTEGDVDNWSLESIDCGDGVDAAAIEVQPGETVNCEITNVADPGTIVSGGPYLLESFRPGERMVLVKNPHFGDYVQAADGSTRTFAVKADALQGIDVGDLVDITYTQALLISVS